MVSVIFLHIMNSLSLSYSVLEALMIHWIEFCLQNGIFITEKNSDNLILAHHGCYKQQNDKKNISSLYDLGESSHPSVKYTWFTQLPNLKEISYILSKFNFIVVQYSYIVIEFSNLKELSSYKIDQKPYAAEQDLEMLFLSWRSFNNVWVCLGWLRVELLVKLESGGKGKVQQGALQRKC